jgi:ribonucleoside-diphosphate reductase subunit M1
LPLPSLQHAEQLDSEIVYDRDFDYDYFGFKVCS